MLTRDQILSMADLPRQFVNIPEWGSDGVHIRTLSGRELWDFQRRFAGKPSDVAEVITSVVVACVCDAEGSPLFTADDAEALQAKNPLALSRVANAAFALNPALTAQGIASAEKN
jgi:hypothetical protein